MRINCLLLYTIYRLPGSNLIWTRMVKNIFENQTRKWYVTNHRFHQHKYMYLWMVVLFTFPRLRSLFIVIALTPLEWNESLRVCSRIHVHEHVIMKLRTYLNKRKINKCNTIVHVHFLSYWFCDKTGKKISGKLGRIKFFMVAYTRVDPKVMLRMPLNREKPGKSIKISCSMMSVYI